MSYGLSSAEEENLEAEEEVEPTQELELGTEPSESFGGQQDSVEDALDEEEVEEAARDDEGSADDDGTSLTQEEAARRRAENIRALQDNTLCLSRRALMPRLLTVASAEATLRRPFRTPHPSAPSASSVSRGQRAQHACCLHCRSKGFLCTTLTV